jgi:hypothetical protein
MQGSDRNFESSATSPGRVPIHTNITFTNPGLKCRFARDTAVATHRAGAAAEAAWTFDDWPDDQSC